MDQAIKLKLDGTNSERLYEKRRAEYNATYREVKSANTAGIRGTGQTG